MCYQIQHPPRSLSKDSGKMSITYPKKKRLSNLPPFWFLLLSKKSSMARCMYIFFCFRLSLSFSTPWQQPATLDENKTRGFPNVHSDTYTPPSVLCLEGGGMAGKKHGRSHLGIKMAASTSSGLIPTLVRTRFYVCMR